MKASDFSPFYYTSPALEEDADIYVCYAGAENYEGRAGIFDIFDVTNRDRTVNRLFVDGYSPITVEMLLPCKLADLVVEADFKGRAFIALRDRHYNRLYRACIEHAVRPRPIVEDFLETSG
jgi:hypothetical protein